MKEDVISHFPFGIYDFSFAKLVSQLQALTRSIHKEKAS